MLRSLNRPLKTNGVRPRNAVCTHCGYQLGGIPINDKVVVCPECAHLVVFAFTRNIPRSAAGRRRFPVRGLTRALLLAMLAALAIVALRV